MARVKRSRYRVKKIYLIGCETCNEDITRTLSGFDVETRAEAEQAVRDHEAVFHPETGGETA